jgi:hypothetical protein
MGNRFAALAGALVPLAGIIAAGCGASSPASPAKSVAAATSTVSSPQPPAAHLRILSPHAGAHTGQTIVARVRVTGGGSVGSRSFVYRLDRRRPQRGSSRLTFRRLAPGRHRLVVSLENGARATAAVHFTVRAPKPRPAVAGSAAAPTPSTTTAATPAPTTSTASTAAPAPTTTAAPPTTNTTSASPPSQPPASGIPQNGGGDGDGDNQGAPSDGDGNI